MKRIVSVLFCATLALPVGCGKTPYKRIATAYNVLLGMKKIAEQFDSSVKVFQAGKRAECKDLHKIKTPEFDRCVLPAVRLSRTWTGEKAGVKTGKGALPILQAAQKATKIALDAAFDYVKSNEQACSGENPPKNCHGDWRALLKPGLCAAWTVVDAGVKLGAFKATTDPTYKLVAAAVGAFACGK